MMNRILVAGMPNSGKSTYIGALRHIMIAQEIPSALEITGLSADEAHLNKLEQDWLDGKKIPRTKSSTETWVELKIKDKETAKEGTLSLPDLRGESFEQPATLGHLNDELEKELTTTEGVLLFTNADKEDDKLMISDLGDILVDGAEDSLASPKRFDAREMPEEAKVVEFLQWANRPPRYARRRNLALLISAWDVVGAGNSHNPNNWLREHCAMLEQFLRYNSHLWNVRVYGVSAQGGKLPRDRAKLMKIAKPSERVRVIGPDAHMNDITAPLRWLISAAPGK
jgi:Double-GTPase 1